MLGRKTTGIGLQDTWRHKNQDVSIHSTAYEFCAVLEALDHAHACFLIGFWSLGYCTSYSSETMPVRSTSCYGRQLSQATPHYYSTLCIGRNRPQEDISGPRPYQHAVVQAACNIMSSFTHERVAKCYGHCGYLTLAW